MQTIMKITAHSSVTLSERYVHPTPEGMEHAFERVQELNATRAEEAMVEEAKVQAAAAGGASEVHTISTTVKKPRFRSSCMCLKLRHGPLAQRFEQRTHNAFGLDCTLLRKAASSCNKKTCKRPAPHHNALNCTELQNELTPKLTALCSVKRLSTRRSITRPYAGANLSVRFKTICRELTGNCADQTPPL